MSRNYSGEAQIYRMLLGLSIYEMQEPHHISRTR
jgi:hypothetical protein